MFRERLQIWIYVVAVMLVADFVMFGYLPLHERMKSVNQTKTEQALVIAKASAESKQLPALRQQLQKLQKAVSGYEANVPTQRSLGAFLQQIANIMTEQDLSEQVVAPGTEIEADDGNCIPVDVKCKGSLAQLFEFYKRLQSMDRLVRIEHVELMNDSDFTGQVSMQTKAVVYYRPNAEQS
ncbi:MAG: type 4a pilus biogenesis protein PilO [Phycisphaerales bacterium]|nr:MAG: type 4a pilus biogenesis protein PilO [Phycisphaerales bacterium]